jgi:hypothetical protein
MYSVKSNLYSLMDGGNVDGFKIMIEKINNLKNKTNEQILQKKSEIYSRLFLICTYSYQVKLSIVLLISNQKKSKIDSFRSILFT